MGNTIEQRVAETILQKTQPVAIGGETYQVAPPSMATLILASELVAQLPAIKLNPEDIVTESLYIAKDCRILGDIIATLILGAKGLKENKQIEKKRLFGLVSTFEEVEIDHKAVLAEKVLLEVSPGELPRLLATLLQQMKVADFFVFTTSLIEINLLKLTRGVVKTTASGL